MILAAVACLGVLAIPATASDFMIESPRITDWGNWGQYEKCPEGSFVYGARLKVEYFV